MRLGCIYLVAHVDSGRVYVGKTVKSPRRRWGQHVAAAGRGSDFYLHRAIRKFGVESFVLCVLAADVPEADLVEFEREMIAAYCADAPQSGFNLNSGGTGGAMTGEAERRRLAGLRSPRFKEQRSLKYSGEGNPFAGRRHSAKTRLILSEAAKGKPNAKKGTHISADTKRKISSIWAGKASANEVVSMYGAGLDVDGIAKDLRIGRSSVYRWLNKAGVVQERLRVNGRYVRGRAV